MYFDGTFFCVIVIPSVSNSDAIIFFPIFRSDKSRRQKHRFRFINVGRNESACSKTRT